MKSRQTIWSRISDVIKGDYFFTIMMMVLGLLTVLYAIVAAL